MACKEGLSNTSSCAGKICSPISMKNLLLYGREDEFRVLLDEYQRCLNGFRIVWIYGSVGVGKSELVHNTFQKKKNFCSSKFDSFPSTKPYSAIVKILSIMIGFLKTSDCPKVSVNPNVALILMKLLPISREVITYEEVEGIMMHSQKLMTEDKLDEWGFLKFKQAIRFFVKAASEVLVHFSDSPLIFHMEDLHWADANSLDVIRFLVSGSDDWKSFLFLGSYRTSEAEGNGAFVKCKKSIEASRLNMVTEICLKNLTKTDMSNLVTELMGDQGEKSQLLANALYEKTNGNPRKTVSSLQYLLENKMMQYSPLNNKYNCKESEAHALLSERSTGVLKVQISNLPLETAEFLKIASCLGLEVNITLISLILKKFGLIETSEGFDSALQDAVSRKLIVLDLTNDVFVFKHNGIREIAYQLIEYQTRVSTHWKIGQYILGLDQKLITSLSSEKILLVVDQLNRGRYRIDSEEDIIELAQLNFMAAEVLIAASAFQMAQDNLEVVLELLGSDGWNLYYDLTMASHRLLATASFGNGHMKKSLYHINEISRESKNDDDCLQAQILSLEVLSCQGKVEECIQLSLILLDQLQHPRLPNNPGMANVLKSFFRVKRILKALSDDDILNLPECNDIRALRILRIMGILGLVAMFAGKDSLVPIISCQVIELSVTKGVNSFSSYAFSCFGFALTMTDDFDGAFRFGSLALQMMNRFHEDPKTLVMVYGIYYHVRKPILDAINPTLRAYYLAFSNGDLTFAGQAGLTHILLRYISGTPLNIMVDDIFSFCDQLKSYNQTLVWDVFVILQRSCLELTGRSTEIIKLTNLIFDDTAFKRYLQESNASKGLFHFSLYTFPCRFFLDNFDSALEHAEVCWKANGIQGAFPLAIPYFLFSALTALERWKVSNRFNRFRYWLIFRKNHRKLISWSSKGNPNTDHLVKLLDAELLATQKHVNPDEVKSSFDLSIAKASRAGYIHHAALANERAGDFFLGKRDIYWAKHYLRKSKILYVDWGAATKVAQMERKFGSLAQSEMPEHRFSIPIIGRSRRDVIARVDALRSGQNLVPCRSVSSDDS